MATAAESLKAQIQQAFAQAKYPGDDCLRRSDQSDEPFLLEEEFRGRTDWRTMDARFIDQAPDGFGSALSFFSREAFRFYLPAYLIADIDAALLQSDPLFHLCYGLDDKTRDERVNPNLYGDQTWFQLQEQRFALFTRQETSAIVAYLLYMLESGRLVDFEAQSVDEALDNYWLARAGESTGSVLAAGEPPKRTAHRCRQGSRSRSL
jgi:hypothetical protein